MPEEHTDLLNGHSVQKQFDSKRIAEAMRMSIFHAGELGHFAEHPTVVFTQGFLGASPGPEPVGGGKPRASIKLVNYELRQLRINGRSGLCRVQRKSFCPSNRSCARLAASPILKPEYLANKIRVRNRCIFTFPNFGRLELMSSR